MITPAEYIAEKLKERMAAKPLPPDTTAPDGRVMNDPHVPRHEIFASGAVADLAEDEKPDRAKVELVSNYDVDGEGWKALREWLEEFGAELAPCGFKYALEWETLRDNGADVDTMGRLMLSFNGGSK